MPGEGALAHGPEMRCSTGLLNYVCRQTFTAESSRITASAGSRTLAGTIPKSIAPMKLPAIEPAAITTMNHRLRADGEGAVPAVAGEASRLSGGSLRGINQLQQPKRDQRQRSDVQISLMIGA